jgi:hypothetical protein
MRTLSTFIIMMCIMVSHMQHILHLTRPSAHLLLHVTTWNMICTGCPRIHIFCTLIIESCIIMHTHVTNMHTCECMVAHVATLETLCAPMRTCEITFINMLLMCSWCTVCVTHAHVVHISVIMIYLIINSICFHFIIISLRDL